MLELDIEASFNSVESLRGEMIAAADAMFGPGFVWLVVDTNARSERRLYVLNTYLAGTPYSNLYHRRQQNQDMAPLASSSDKYRKGLDDRQYMDQTMLSEPKGRVQSGGAGRDYRGQEPLVTRPLLCVNTWQHVYMTDYGVAGRRDYLNAWWERVNWDQVMDEFNTSGSATKKYSGLRDEIRTYY